MRRNKRRLGAVALGIAVAVGLTVAAPSAAYAESNGGVRIMPLGDSITDGWNVPGGYRIGLWQRMASTGHAVDFVGSGSNGPAELGDHDHEGHGGWRIRDIDGSIAQWIRAANPRTVLLQIGTNDVNLNDDPGNAPARLSALIDKIRANAPLVELFVAQVTPLADAAKEAQIQAYNAAVPGIVAGKGPLTHLVDMHSGFQGADLADGIHPTAAGYDKLAERWAAALQAVPSSLTPVSVPPVGAGGLLVNPQSKRCLDVAGSGTVEGTQVQLWDCNAGANQRWTRTAANELRVYGNRCLDIAFNGTADGTKVQIWTCNNSSAQHFTFNADGTIVHQGSGKCIDVAAAGTANGTLVQLYQCNNTGAQRWSAR
ncbi:RICIN domain-containing protein [Micromonosporaceae bacterium Da 78-11]